VKIAFPTDDGMKISAHFGRAPYFVVADVDGDGAPHFEQRAKAYHGEAQHEGHGHDHADMFAPIADCQVLIAGGMGQGALDAAAQQGMEVILTGEKDIRAAFEAYRAGRLTSDPRRIHRHNASGGAVRLEP
jgi:predicted Fe-Mo cluster-binding NifX family protein